MIELKQDQYQKILLLDKLFNLVSLEKLAEFSEISQVVAKLKGESDNLPCVLSALVGDYALVCAEVNALKYEVDKLKADIRDLIKALSTFYSQAPYSTELTSLKSRHSIY